jgi:putative transposase
MKMTGYSEPQILAILRQAEGGVPMAELCREHELSNASFYKWRAKYGGTDASMVSQTNAGTTSRLPDMSQVKDRAL